jgi:hypothetical protein
MTDLEMTKLCAEAMGWEFESYSDSIGQLGRALKDGKTWYAPYWPLTDDAQAMALVKRFRLEIYPVGGTNGQNWSANGGRHAIGDAKDLNRAIVECVAKMQKEKSAAIM